MAATMAPERSAFVAYENETAVSMKLAFTVALSVADDVVTSVASLVATVGRTPVVVKFFISPVAVPVLLAADAL